MGVWGPENRLPSSELWNAAGHLLSRGWLQNQARTKPRGYAGDHELLSRIYEWRLCDDPLGRLFDRYFQEQACRGCPQSNDDDGPLDRRAGVKLDDSPPTTHNSPHIALVGSAFGLEIEDALRRLGDRQPSRLRVTLLDLDPAAIDFARHQLAEFLPPERLIATSTNLFRLPERHKTAKRNICLIRFSAQDYSTTWPTTPRPPCSPVSTRLAPGGRMVVFQFAPHNPTRAYMEWFANWYLTYRDTATLSPRRFGGAARRSSHLRGGATGHRSVCALQNRRVSRERML